MGAAYNIMFDLSQQPTYAYPNQYETQTFSSQQFQPQQQSQQHLSSDMNTLEFGYDHLSSNPSQQIPPHQPANQRPTSISRQATTRTNDAPPITTRHTLNAATRTGYTYGTRAEWMTDPQQIQSPQTNIPPQMNASYNVMFDPSQQPTYTHPNQYETQTYFSQQFQPQQ